MPYAQLGHTTEHPATLLVLGWQGNAGGLAGAGLTVPPVPAFQLICQFCPLALLPAMSVAPCNFPKLMMPASCISNLLLLAIMLHPKSSLDRNAMEPMLQAVFYSSGLVLQGTQDQE